MSFFSIKNNRRVAWLTIFAVMLAALMPALSSARAGQKSPDGWTEICTATGVQYVLLDKDQAPPSKTENHHGGHCPYCLSTNVHFLPTAIASVAFLTAEHDKPRSARISLDCRAEVLLSASPRGPPLTFL